MREGERDGGREKRNKIYIYIYLFWKSSVHVFFHLQEKSFKNAEDGKKK